MTGAQVREARRLLGWSADRLVRFCGIPTAVVRTFENTGKMRKPAMGWPLEDREAVIRVVLEEAGIEFIAENGGGPGVRLRAARG